MTEPNIPLVLCISLSFLMCTIAAQLQQEQVYRYSARIEGLLDTVAMNRNITGSAIRPSASSKEYRERFVTWRSNALKEDFFFSNQTLCSDLHPSLMNCSFNSSCVMGSLQQAACSVDTRQLQQLFNKTCSGGTYFWKTYSCFYCWQLSTGYKCQTALPFACTSGSSVYKSRCTTDAQVFCLGSRNFYKNQRCNFTTGKSWVVALLYSVFLGAFGADRFYLDYAGWGVFKLLTFGGFGVWTLIDAILIVTGYLNPADGSVFS